MLRAEHRYVSPMRARPGWWVASFLVPFLGLATPLAAQDLEDRARVVLEQEDAISALRGPMGELTRSIQNLSLPGTRARMIFADQVTVVDLDAPGEVDERILGLDARATSWKLGPEKVRLAESLELWSAFLERVDYFESGGFYSIRGAFDATDPTLFCSPSGFTANARLADGSLAWIKASLELDWRRSGAEQAPTWRLEAFFTTSFEVTRIPRPLYSEVTREALSPADLAQAQRSLRDEFLVDWVSGIRAGETDLDVFMTEVHGALVDGSLRGDWAHLAVVDVDRDGWDDLYVLPDDATALFFRNKGDGSFEEIGARLGLALENVNAALFADLDNDGDDDAVLSHYPERDADPREHGVAVRAGTGRPAQPDDLDHGRGLRFGWAAGPLPEPLQRGPHRRNGRRPRASAQERRGARAELSRDDGGRVPRAGGSPLRGRRAVRRRPGTAEHTPAQPGVLSFRARRGRGSRGALLPDAGVGLVGHRSGRRPGPLRRERGRCESARPERWRWPLHGRHRCSHARRRLRHGRRRSATTTTTGCADIYVTNMYSKAGQRIAASHEVPRNGS